MTDCSSKRILLISYHFPPGTSVGGFRIAGFKKYLPNEGWKPYVLTLQNGARSDSGHLGNRDTIFRAYSHISIREGYLRLKCAWLKAAKGEKMSPEELELTYVRPASSSSDGMMIARLKRLIASLIFLPDECRNWILPATLMALRIVKGKGIRHVLTSCPPYSVNLVGLFLKILLPRIVWVADFRDPWIIPVLKENYPSSILSMAIERKLERWVINQASLVLTTTPHLAEAFRRHYKGCPKDKFRCIPNGYDLDELPKNMSHAKFSKFTISYTGSLYFGRTPEPVFRSIYELHQEGLINLREIEIRLVGHCRNCEGISVSDLAASYGLASVVNIIDRVSHTDAMKIIAKSHIALLLAPGQPYQIPAKTYEYMGLGTPILALTDKGATRDLVDSTKLGKAVLPTDIDGIKNFIIGVLRGETSWISPQGRSASTYRKSEIVHNLATEILDFAI